MPCAAARRRQGAARGGGGRGRRGLGRSRGAGREVGGAPPLADDPLRRRGPTAARPATNCLQRPLRRQRLPRRASARRAPGGPRRRRPPPPPPCGPRWRRRRPRRRGRPPPRRTRRRRRRPGRWGWPAAAAEGRGVALALSERRARAARWLRCGGCTCAPRRAAWLRQSVWGATPHRLVQRRSVEQGRHQGGLGGVDRGVVAAPVGQGLLQPRLPLQVGPAGRGGCVWRGRGHAAGHDG
jgi:hypothetical protein